jgi:hypothetical protein
VLRVASLIPFRLGEASAADYIEAAIMTGLEKGYCTDDIMSGGKGIHIIFLFFAFRRLCTASQTIDQRSL